MQWWHQDFPDRGLGPLKGARVFADSIILFPTEMIPRWDLARLRNSQIQKMKTADRESVTVIQLKKEILIDYICF